MDALLNQERGLDSFLEQPAYELKEATGSSTTEEKHVGSTIGPYKLMEQIGEGGFGLVFVAEQREPVRRRVALKLIKPGMDSKEIIARFEAERQALALMDHPNIARVLDAGTTESGRPYFVMELVRGIPDHDLLRRESALAERTAGAVSARLPGRPACASKGNHSSRHQALQSARHDATMASRCRR